MKRIFTSLAPNLERDDLLLSLSLLVRTWRYCRGNSAQAVERWFEEFTGFDAAIAFTSGRGALYALLKSLHLPAGSEVLLQAYTCVAVPAPAFWAGLTPVYVDIDASLTMSAVDLEKKITPQSKVLIIQHTFGVAANMEELLAVAQKHGLFVIEDCAHALKAAHQGARLGSFGDASFFSFGRDKAVSAVFGGVVAVRDGALGERVRAFAKTQGEASLGWVFQQLSHAPILAFAKAFYDVFALGRFKLALARKLGVISRAVYPVERSGGRVVTLCKQMPEAIAQLALHQLAKVERFSLHRQQVAAWYSEQLHKLGLAYQKTGDGAPLRVAVFYDRAGELIAYARKQRVELGDWYTVSIAPQGVDNKAISYRVGSCPVAERYAKTTFNLPTHIGIGTLERARVISVVESFLSQWKSK